MKSIQAGQARIESTVGMLSPESFAEYFGLHPEYVRDRIRRGEIRARKLGRRWRIPVAERNRVETEGLNSRSRKEEVIRG